MSRNSDGESKFEAAFRKNTVNASIKLDRSDFGFEIFRKSRCNKHFWERTRQGGFLLKDGKSPSEAINDIFKNSSLYATECATAIVIIFYKACLDSVGTKIFNDMFHSIYLMNWHYVDDNLELDVVQDVLENIPGDCRYFKNPDVDPRTPQWQGENTIYLGNGLFYGHGIGINTASEIINTLNSTREAGSNTSAYLMDSATRPDFDEIFSIYSSLNTRTKNHTKH